MWGEVGRGCGGGENDAGHECRLGTPTHARERAGGPCSREGGAKWGSICSNGLRCACAHRASSRRCPLAPSLGSKTSCENRPSAPKERPFLFSRTTMWCGIIPHHWWDGPPPQTTACRLSTQILHTHSTCGFAESALCYEPVFPQHLGSFAPV